MEFMAFQPMSTLCDAVRICERVGHANARILIDTLHLDRSGGTAEDLADVDLSLVGYVHICDAVAERPTDTAAMLDEARSARLYPGDGALPLRAMLDALPNGMPISLEAPVWANRHLPVHERIEMAWERTSSFLRLRT